MLAWLSTMKSLSKRLHAWFKGYGIGERQRIHRFQRKSTKRLLVTCASLEDATVPMENIWRPSKVWIAVQTWVNLWRLSQKMDGKLPKMACRSCHRDGMVRYDTTPIFPLLLLPSRVCYAVVVICHAMTTKLWVSRFKGVVSCHGLGTLHMVSIYLFRDLSRFFGCP